VNRLGHGVLLGVLIALAGAVLVALAPWVDLEEDRGLLWLFNLRGPVPAPPEVVIVAIDEESAQRLGLPDKPRDWPRTIRKRLPQARESTC
jgi:adenylate cyclase